MGGIVNFNFCLIAKNIHNIHCITSQAVVFVWATAWN